MKEVSKEYMALLTSIYLVIHVLDKKGVIPEEEMGYAFSVYAGDMGKVDPIIPETLQRIADMCGPKKKGSVVNLTLISNNNENTEPSNNS